MKDKYTTSYSGVYSNPGNTIMNNNSSTTYYSLSILELIDLCDEYHENFEDVSAKSSTIELLVDYIIKNRK